MFLLPFHRISRVKEFRILIQPTFDSIWLIRGIRHSRYGKSWPMENKMQCLIFMNLTRTLSVKRILLVRKMNETFDFSINFSEKYR
jgi:hypothetical protein